MGHVENPRTGTRTNLRREIMGHVPIPENCYMSPISHVPAFFLRRARELCDKFECVPLTKDDATIAAELRRKYRWKLPDALQAALAKKHGLKLVTRDARGFDEKKYAFVLIPYRLG